MADKTGEKQGNGRFRPGTSGNPSGRPRGARNKAQVLLDQLGDDAGERILKSVIAKADRGDLRAAELVLRRIWPEPHGRKVTFKMPIMRSVADAASALAAIVFAVGDGVLTPAEARELAGLVTVYTQTLEGVDVEQRLDALQQAASEIRRYQINGHEEAS